MTDLEKRLYYVCVEGFFNCKKVVQYLMGGRFVASLTTRFSKAPSQNKSVICIFAFYFTLIELPLCPSAFLTQSLMPCKP